MSALGATGYWIAQGTAVALVTTSGPSDAGCLNLGLKSAKGFGTKPKQGPFNGNGDAGTWYTKRTPAA